MFQGLSVVKINLLLNIVTQLEQLVVVGKFRIASMVSAMTLLNVTPELHLLPARRGELGNFSAMF